MEYYWELRRKNAQNIKALMCPLYKNAQNIKALMCPLYKNAPLREKGVDRFARADTQSRKQQEEDKWWRCGVMIFCNWLYEFIKACRSGCNPSLRRGIEHTQKKYVLENDTHLRKNWSLLCDSKNSAMWQKKQRLL